MVSTKRFANIYNGKHTHVGLPQTLFATGTGALIDPPLLREPRDPRQVTRSEKWRREGSIARLHGDKAQWWWPPHRSREAASPIAVAAAAGVAAVAAAEVAVEGGSTDAGPGFALFTMNLVSPSRLLGLVSASLDPRLEVSEPPASLNVSLQLLPSMTSSSFSVRVPALHAPYNGEHESRPKSG